MQHSPVYRLTVYAPRSVDPTETTVLTPLAGAPHADPFQVASAQGIAGYQPFLQLPSGRAGRLDPRTRRLDTGQLTLRCMDKRTTELGNEDRWITAFLGNENGVARLIGLLVRVDESLDGGSSWAPYWTGRIQDARLASRVWFDLVVRDLQEELGVDVFVGRPHSSVTYAHLTPLAPLGLSQSYGDFPTVAGIKGNIRLSGYASGSGEIEVAESPLDGPTAYMAFLRTVVTEAVRRFAGEMDPRIRVVITPTATGVAAEYGLGRIKTHWAWPFPRYVGAGKQRVSSDGHEADLWFLKQVGIQQLPGGAALPADGAAVTFRILRDDSPTEDVPLLINYVQPVQLWKDLLEGKFSRLNQDGTVKRSFPYDAAAFDALIADATIPKGRFTIEEKSTLNEWVEEHICLPFNLAYHLDSQGRVMPIDMRMPSAVPAVPTIVEADLDRNAAPTWSHERKAAVTRMEITHYAEYEASNLDLLTHGEFPNIPASRIWSRDLLYLPVDFAAETDLGEQTLKINAVGYRASQSEEILGQMRLNHVRRLLDKLVTDIRGPYGRGAMTARLVCRRTANTTGCQIGDWRIVDVDALPDPSSSRRSGNRLMRCIERQERGPRLELTFLDAGPGTVALPPTLGALAIATDDPWTAELPVTLNAAGEPAVVEMAVTDTAAAVRPAEATELWTHAARMTASGTARIPEIPFGMRIWFRARSVPADAKTLQLSSNWVFPVPEYLDASISARVRNLELEVEDGSVKVLWERYAQTAGVRIYYVVHRPGSDSASPLTGSYQDADAALGELTISGVNLRSGEAITVEVEPWTGWTGSAVAGTAGERVRASDLIAADEAAYSVHNLHIDFAQSTATQWALAWDQGAAVQSVKGASQIFTGRAETDADKAAVRAAAATLAGGVLMVPKAGEWQFSLSVLIPMVPQPTTGVLSEYSAEWWKEIGANHQVRTDVSFLSVAGGQQETMELKMYDPVGIAGVPVAYRRVGASGGWGMGTNMVVGTAPGTWQYTYDLDPKHNVHVMVSIPRHDGGMPIDLGPFTGDVDTTAEITQVTTSYQDKTGYVRVQGDTDCVELWYEGSDDGGFTYNSPALTRFATSNEGEFTFTRITNTRKLFRVHGRNRLGTQGPYHLVRTDRYYGPVADVVREIASELGSTGQLELAPVTDAVFDEVLFRTQQGQEPWTTETMDTVAPYVAQVALVEKHSSKIGYRVKRNGVTVQQGVVTFDSNRVADITQVTVGLEGSGFTARVEGDSDCLSIWYQKWNGTGWDAEVQIGVSARTGEFAGTRPTNGSDDLFRVYGKNHAGVVGPYHEIRIEPYEGPVGMVMREVASELGSTGQLELVPVSGSVYTDVVFRTQQGKAAWSAEVVDAAAPLIQQVSLVEKHPSKIEYRVRRAGSTVQQGVVTFDLGDTADIASATVAYSGDAFTVRVEGDADCASLFYQEHDGVAWGLETSIAAARQGSFGGTASTTKERQFRIYGKTAAGVAGPFYEVNVDRYYGTIGSVVRENAMESGNVGTLELIPVTGAVWDEILFKTQVGNGSWSVEAADTVSPYTQTVSLVEKHPSKIAYRVRRSGVTVQQGVVTFDLGTLADVTDSVAHYDGAGTATVRIKCDSDTDTGVLGAAQYRVDGGATTDLTLAGDRTASFTVAQSQSATQLVEIRAWKGGVASLWFPVTIEKYIPAPEIFPTVASAQATVETQGACATTKLRLQISFTLVNPKSGYTYSVSRYRTKNSGGVNSDYTPDYTVASPTAITDTTGSVTLLDETTALRTTESLDRIRSGSRNSDEESYWYVITIRRSSDSAVVHTGLSNTLHLYTEVCP